MTGTPATLSVAVRRNWPAYVAFAIALTALLYAFRADWAGMVAQWSSDSTFGHAVLIMPMSLYLIWTKREFLASVPIRESWSGVLLLVVASLIWIIGDVLSIAVIGHFALVLMLQGLVIACFGTDMYRAALFPMLYLFFMVPAGKAIVPTLMESTADLALLLARLTGVPVVREGMYLHIPAGTFEVATACSGAKFLIAAAALSTFFAHLIYTSWRKRVTYVFAFLIVAVLMNGFRAYLLVLLGHLTDMNWGHETWHVPLGWLMFAITIAVMIRIGARYADPPGIATPRAAVASDLRLGRYVPVAIASLAALSLTPVATAALSRPPADSAVQAMVALPGAQGSWTAPPDLLPWRPYFSGALADSGHTYVSEDRLVDIYVGAYQINAPNGGEMIAFHNRIQEKANESLFRRQKRSVDLGNGRTMQVLETIDPSTPLRLVWYWYQVGDHIVLNQYEGKLFELMAFANGQTLERVVVLASQAHDVEDARSTLAAFVVDHSKYFSQFLE